METKIDVEIRPCVSIDIPEGYTGKSDSYIQVTEWSNGDGYDVEFWDVPGHKKKLELPHFLLERILQAHHAIVKYYDDKDKERENQEIINEIKEEIG